MNRLAGKTAIVTGVAVDIGRACVERMTEEGAAVVTSDDPEAAKAAAGSVHPIGQMGEPDGIGWAVLWLRVRRGEVRHRRGHCHRRRLHGAMT